MTPTDTDTSTGSETATSGGLRGKASNVKTKAAGAYESARERTSAAYDSVRGRASRAGERTSEGIDTNPVAALVVGLGLGAVVAALLPRTRQEERLLGGAGRKITDTARQAGRSAADAGKAKLDELGYNSENLRGKVSSLRSDAKEIAGAAAQKAKESART